MIGGFALDKNIKICYKLKLILYFRGKDTMLEISPKLDLKGSWVLGHNQAQGGSELQAGARADLIPSPITKALSSFKGRVAAKTMRFMFSGSLEPLLNYAALRPFAEMEAVRLALGAKPADKLVLDPAAGFAPQFYWLAQEFPQTRFMELDPLRSIEEKRYLLHPFGIPENLRLKAADLSVIPLDEVLSERADVIMALGAYVKHSAYQDLLHYLKDVLKHDGRVIGSFPFAPAVENLSQNSAIFRRVAGDPAGIVHSEAQLRGIFEKAGYEIEAILKFSELAKKWDKPTPADIEIIVVARVL